MEAVASAGIDAGRDPKDASFLPWVLGTLCALHRRPFDAALVEREFPPPHDETVLVHAAARLGFDARPIERPIDALSALPLPALLSIAGSYAMLLRVDDGQAVWLRAGETEPACISMEQVAALYRGRCHLFKPQADAPADPDAARAAPAFGFRWFVPELLKHRAVWRDVLGASLVLQLLALALPLFTQTIIDKVVVHRTESTLVALGIGMAVFMLFTALLSWVRQFLILHTGNRVDAVLGTDVFRHLMRLPDGLLPAPADGVIAARFHGVENIREFIASAAIGLLLDVPFLAICVAVMFWYSVPLTLIVLAVLTVILLLSLAVAPVLRTRLNEQFLLGARNQAFLTEYVAGIETVKSLQLEPQLESRYADYLAAYLRSGFLTKQIGNSYQVLANTLEQTMTLLVLLGGAWLVMHPILHLRPVPRACSRSACWSRSRCSPAKLSQPMLRTGRAVAAVPAGAPRGAAARRPDERAGRAVQPGAATLSRSRAARSRSSPSAFVTVRSCRRSTARSNLDIRAGETIAIMGPCGCGK